ncbi:MAG: acyltransferase [Variovorax sp.]
MASNSEQVYSLQILRGAAATAVVYLHTFTLPLNGSFGVDLFFVVSGFVMCMIIDSGRPTPTVFLLNRITRIVPLYWAVTTMVLVVASIAPHLMGSTVADLGNYLKSLFFIPHFRHDGQLFPVLMPGWTLNYEAVFYLTIFATLIVRKENFAWPVCMLLALFFITSSIDSPTSVVYQFFHNSLWFEFVLGILCFKIHRAGLIASVPKAVAVVVILVSAAVMVGVDLKTDRLINAGLPSFFILLFALRLEESIRSLNPVVLRLLIHIGDASYATYLSHMFVIGLVERIAFPMLGFDEKNMLTAAFTIGCCLIAGSLIYRFVDLPMMRECRKLTGRWQVRFVT